jgi:hypothetical protein
MFAVVLSWGPPKRITTISMTTTKLKLLATAVKHRGVRKEGKHFPVIKLFAANIRAPPTVNSRAGAPTNVTNQRTVAL